MKRVIVDAKSGKQTITDFTSEELDEMLVEPLPGTEERVSALEEAMLALLEA